MARGVNKCILVGSLGKDPEVRYAANGSAIANISIATSESYKDKNTGQKVEKTEWHCVVFFGKLAEIVGEYCRKGSQIYVEGKLKTRKWQDQQGQDKYTTEVVVDGFNGQMQLLGGNPQGQQQGGHIPQQGNGGGFQPQQSQQPAKTARMQSASNHQQGGPQNPMTPPVDFDSDIPF